MLFQYYPENGNISICNMCSILGKRFAEGGLKDILIKSHIVAAGSINGVLDGKQYNRAVRAHKYVYGGLMRLAWGDPELLVTVNLLLERVNTMSSDLKQEVFDELLQSRLLTEVVTAWIEFLDKLRCNNGEL